MQEEPDPDVGPQLTQHPRNELQLVVVDPHRRARRPRRRPPPPRSVRSPLGTRSTTIVRRSPDGWRRGTAATASRWRNRGRTRRTPAPRSEPREARFLRTTPGQSESLESPGPAPIQTPLLSRSTGTSAVTRPPELNVHAEPPPSSMRRTGSRFATTTRSAVGDESGMVSTVTGSTASWSRTRFHRGTVIVSDFDASRRLSLES